MSNSMWPRIAEEYEPPDELYLIEQLPKTPEARLLLKAKVNAITKKAGHAIQMHKGAVVTVPDSLVTEALKLMSWYIFKAPSGHAFLTGDNPVFYDRGFGLGSSYAEVSLPISSEYAMVASWWKFTNRSVQEAIPVVVEEINLRTIHNATKHLYSSKAERWVTNLFGKAKYNYRPMYSPKSNFKVAESVIDGPGTKPHLKLNVQLPLIP